MEQKNCGKFPTPYWIIEQSTQFCRKGPWKTIGENWFLPFTINGVLPFTINGVLPLLLMVFKTVFSLNKNSETSSRKMSPHIVNAPGSKGFWQRTDIFHIKLLWISVNPLGFLEVRLRRSPVMEKCKIFLNLFLLTIHVQEPLFHHPSLNALLSFTCT